MKYGCVVVGKATERALGLMKTALSASHDQGCRASKAHTVSTGSEVGTLIGRPWPHNSPFDSSVILKPLFECDNLTWIVDKLDKDPLAVTAAMWDAAGGEPGRRI